MDDRPADRRREIPSTDALLADPVLVAAADRHGRAMTKQAVHRVQQRARDGDLAGAELGVRELAARVAADLPPGEDGVQRVINATGVVVHTNLGRSPLSAEARTALAAAAGYAAVEVDLPSGGRGSRGRHVLDRLLSAVPGAESALVVNNNAAALLLTTMALAAGREVVISKGELVEIGDGFRIAAILSAAGARLREVGSTNRTTVADYATALSPDTAFVIKVHRANFTVAGYTGEAGVAELAALDVPVVVDVGSGLLRPHPVLPAEPDVQSALAEGAALVTASADKLLGGPQAGLVVGRADLVQQMRRHPAARAVRVDKLTLAALDATLRHPPGPVLAMITEPYEVVRARADRAASTLGAAGFHAEVVDVHSVVGGGGAPGVRLPSAAIAVPAVLAAPLRVGPLPVIGRVERERCLLDLRTVALAEIDELVAAVLAAHHVGSEEA